MFACGRGCVCVGVRVGVRFYVRMCACVCACLCITYVGVTIVRRLLREGIRHNRKLCQTAFSLLAAH